MASKALNFYDVLTAAIADIAEHGFDSEQRVHDWLVKLDQAARASLLPASVLKRSLDEALTRVFTRATKPSALLKHNPGVSEFTLNNIKPKLRAELQRRILASSQLITLNREASIARTLQRFSGWASSVPKGGTDVAKRAEIKKTVRRGIAGLPFEERRVIIDQGHRLAAAVNDIVAVDGGAIAGEWRHVAEGPPAYQSRPDHVARDHVIYVIRDSWADKQRLIKPVNGYTDDITQPAEEINCRCTYRYIYHLSQLPPDMLTVKGRAALEGVRAKLKAVS